MAAYKEGIKTVIIPDANKGDLSEIEDVVKEKLNFVFVNNIEEVLDIALVKDTVDDKSNGRETIKQ
jgi:ATP-dependent Lon protease